MEKRIITIVILYCITVQVIGQTFNADSLISKLPKQFSGQVYIKKSDAIILNYQTGYANRIFGTPINDSTLFNLGEVSHTFIHYFIKHLVSVNQIKITDPVNKYIKNFPYPDIKISHLVHHKSGLPPNYVKIYHRLKYHDMNVKMVDKAVRFDNEDLLNLLANKKPILSFTPGDSVEYSNFNYLILASIIEKVTFTPFEDFVTRLFKYHNFVFTPTVHYITDDLPQSATGYRFHENDSSFSIFENLRSVGFDYEDGTYGNQHLYLSATNLALWGQFIFPEMDTDFIKKSKTPFHFGNFTYQSSTETIESKGGFGGSYSYLIYFPKSKYILAITSNTYSKEGFEEAIKYLKSVDNL